MLSVGISNNCCDVGLFQLSPFTDLDSEGAEVLLKWKSAKFAFTTMMKCWTGVVILTADPLGLPTLVGMLKDTKVSVYK